ncbi:hypothetical protein AB7M17_005267 [Bradyrhizobium sp. USDA 377]
MTLNLESDIREQMRMVDPAQWSTLQTEICAAIASAKFYAFVAEAERVAELVRFGLMSRAAAADHLHTAAIYNELYFEHGIETIQTVMVAAMASGGRDDA